MPNLITGKFIFSNKADALVTSLKQILDFASANLPLYANAAIINFKLKAIITELLSNAVKHAGNPETAIYILIEDGHINIEKTDSGNQFNPKKLDLLCGKSVGTKVQLSKDPLHCVYAIIEPGMFVRFVCEENEENQIPDINDLTEHFGILIITKSADEFTYQYDQSSGLNTFRASVKFS
ncbi:MAG: hypothetical protein JWR67_2871 [Mucilaginibacter sp.]|nr:hypothetical protein [Mucilaginibacter sp.]